MKQITKVPKLGTSCEIGGTDPAKEYRCDRYEECRLDECEKYGNGKYDCNKCNKRCCQCEADCSKCDLECDNRRNI